MANIIRISNLLHFSSVLFLQNLDYQLFTALNNLAGSYAALDLVFILLSEVTIFVLVALLAVFFMQERRRISSLIQALAAAVIARVVIVSIIRLFFFRPRPFVNFEVNQLVHHDPLEGSFPSGHSAFMFALAFMLFFEDKRWGAVYLFLALLSGAARVVVGVHFPGDIIAGAICGFAAALITKFAAAFFRRRQAASALQQ